MDDLITTLRCCLTPELALPQYRGEHPMSGLCYVATEVLHSLLGGQPMKVEHEGVMHYYLTYPINGEEIVLDATADQFKTLPPWDEGKKTRFRATPTKRAQIVLDRMG